MHSHLDIKINGNSLGTMPDASIDMNMQNPMFNRVEAFSYPIETPIKINRKILGNIEVPQSDKRLSDIDDQQAMVHIDGVPVVSGRIVTGVDEEIDETVSLNIDSITKSFTDLIADLKCTDVPLLPDDEIIIGEKVGQITASGNLTFKVRLRETDDTSGPDHPGGRRYIWTDLPDETVAINFFLDLPALGFSYPGHCEQDSNGVATPDPDQPETSYPDMDVKVKNPKVLVSYINTTMPFDASHPYCNARVCYKHYGVKKTTDGDKTTYETDSEITSDKEQSNEARWPYWVLDANRPQSGICFYVLYFLRCLFKLLNISYNDDALMAVEDMRHLTFFTTKCKYTVKTLTNDFFSGTKDAFQQKVNAWADSRGCGGQLEVVENFGKQVRIDEGEYKFYTLKDESTPVSYTADLQQMLATSDNFPDVSVTEVIESLENSFGIRFLFNQDNNACRAIFLRDVFRSQAAPRKFLGKVLSVHKLTEKNTGIKVCYSAESDAKDQRLNVRNGVRDYDTDYDYIDYPEERDQDVDIIGKTQTITTKTYTDIFKRLSSSDMNVYIDRTTGNAYRIKIDSDAKTAEEWKPVLFEVGGYKGVEIGDCSPSNENLIELVSHFKPVMMNDVNYQEEVANGVRKPYYAAFIDKDMEHEFVPFTLQSVSEFENGSLTLKANMRLKESYDPSETEDGNSPLQETDWGLAVCMMRGGGATAYIEDFDENYDGFSNWRWRMVSTGDYQMYSDSVDAFGGVFDYNGEQEGTGGGDRFSLKMRSYKQPSWADGPICDTQKYILLRGLFDTFMAEYVHFLFDRKPLRITSICTAAELADIINHWTEWFNIDGHVGFINKIGCNVSAEMGIGKVTIDFLTI